MSNELNLSIPVNQMNYKEIVYGMSSVSKMEKEVQNVYYKAIDKIAAKVKNDF